MPSQLSILLETRLYLKTELLHSFVMQLPILHISTYGLTSRGKSLKSLAKSFHQESSLLFRTWVGTIKERMSVRPRIAWGSLILQLPYWMYYVSTYLLCFKLKCSKLRIVYYISQTGPYNRCFFLYIYILLNWSVYY